MLWSIIELGFLQQQYNSNQKEQVLAGAVGNNESWLFIQASWLIGIIWLAHSLPVTGGIVNQQSCL